MVDTALCTFFNWEPTKLGMDVFDVGKPDPDGSPLNTKQNYFNCYLGSTGVTETSKCTTSTSDVKSTTPKSGISINSLQSEQDTLIQQRIQDRTTTLRNMSNPLSLTWPSYNSFHRSLSTPIEMTSLLAGNSLANPISTCMFTANRTSQWFNRPPNNDPWSHEYSQDPTMRSRPCFSSQQTRELEREFVICQYVTRRRRIELAYTLNLTEKQIKTWFQNRRVKERKQKKNASEANESEKSGS